MIKTFFSLQNLILLLVFLIISAGTASAITITQTQTFSGTPDFNSTLTFNKWSNPGSTLQSIEIIMSLNIAGGTLQADNDGALAGNVDFTLGSRGTLVGPGLVWFHAVTATSGTRIFLAANDGDGTGGFDSGGADWANYNGGAAIGQPIVNNTFIGAGNFLSYTGTGTVDLTAMLTQDSKVTGLAGLSSATSPVSVSGILTVKYTDDAPPPAVPEPATLLLLGSGIVGLIGAGRRGRNKVVVEDTV